MKIFIAGCGRSGTTLLRSMLNHHSDVFIPPECGFITDYLKFCQGMSPQKVFKLMKNEPQFKLWLNFPFSFDEEKHKDASSIFSDAHRAALKNVNKKIWGQKTPRFVRHTNLFTKSYPDIKFVLMVRDPRAVTSSFINSRGFNSYLPSIIERWLLDNQFVKEIKQKSPNDCLIIKYEDLVLDAEVTLKRICSFLQISFEEEMLDYYKTGTEEYASSKLVSTISANLRLKPNTKSIDKWKDTLTKEQVRIIEENCFELMDNFGYPVFNKSVSSNMKLKKNSLVLTIAWLKVILDFIRLWPRQLFYIFYRKAVLSLYNKSLRPFREGI